MSRTEKVRKLAGFIWSIAELLRSDYKQADYGKVILPFTVLRRLDCVLEPTKTAVMEFYETKVKSMNLKNPEPLLNQKAGVPFHNISQFTFQKLKGDADNVAANLRNFINGFSVAGREIIEYFNFNDQINRLDKANLLFLIVKKFADIDLHPDAVDSMEMGYVFEELIRKFSELSNETAGEHFTPREVIRLMVNLLFLNDRNILTQEGIVTTIYDPACGTGGMLSLAEEYIKELNQNSKPVVFGQEINPESYAICKSDMLIKGQDISNIKFGNTFTTDGLAHETFDYMLSNPPFGVEWKYRTYFKISKAIADDPNISKKKTSRAIAKFLSLHPHNLAQKTEVIIEHFRQCVMHKIGGKAKAMVVTASRPHVIRYKEAFDNYLHKQGYADIKALVAFTAFTDRETCIEYTESDINGFGEKELPEKFEAVEYQLLIVADKYQTGFDQPLLHTMYVDKKLSGVKAVQTLSRLNRTCPGKEDTFVLDFANDEQQIIDDFQPYYEQTTLIATTDPNRLYDLKNRLDGYQIIWLSEVDAFAKIFFKSQDKLNKRDQGRLHSFIDPAVDRFKGLSEEQQDEFKNSLTAFIRLYAFLSQIMPFADAELEKFYAFVRLLQTKLPKLSQSEAFKLTDEVALEYYRLQKIREGQIILEKSIESSLQPITEAGIPRDKEEQAKLSEIIDILNKRFRTDFTEADKYFFSQIEEALVQDKTLSQQAKSNSIQNFKYGFEDVFLTKLIERMDLNQDIFTKIIDFKDFGEVVKDWMLRKVYTRLTQEFS
ncbi:type I restriction-modification system R subunit [Nostoc linckia NIES-25]|nr:type I restriction-modification system R subunit [Nostoc linckia NIES-25]